MALAYLRVMVFLTAIKQKGVLLFLATMGKTFNTPLTKVATTFRTGKGASVSGRASLEKSSPYSLPSPQ